MRRFVLHHRLRLEERFRKTGDWDFALRLRYRLSFALPLNRHNVEPGAFYLPFKAEFFFPLGEDIEEFFAKQAQYGVGLGYVFNKAWTGEVRYAQQRFRDTIDADLDITSHYVEFRVRSAFRIRDLVKGR